MDVIVMAKCDASKIELVAEFLLKQSNNNKLKKGSLNEAITKFSTSLSIVKRIWRPVKIPNSNKFIFKQEKESKVQQIMKKNSTNC